ncbi:MAG: citryl-CoA lyase [Bacillota bacterium]
MSDQKPLYRTAISLAGAEDILVRGYSLIDLVGNVNLGTMVSLLIKGELPSRAEGEMIEAILVACAEHGVRPPSIQAARQVASGGVQFQACVAAGVLALGDSHGGAIEQCMQVLQEAAAGIKSGEKNAEEVAVEVLSAVRSARRRLPGFGHPVHKIDPRTVRLFQLAEEYGIKGLHCDLAEELTKRSKVILGRALPLNVDGAVAALLSDMGFDWQVGKGFFILGRTFGIVAHVYEEITRERPMAHLPPYELLVYDGPESRPVSITSKSAK